MRGLYVHIPFCKSICSYCNFCKRVPRQGMIINYLKVLEKQFNELSNTNYDTIYIGGGTPSMLTLEELTILLNIFKNVNPLEYTIEVNPESYTHQKGLLMKEMGVNRVSLGAQTFNESHLKTLKREHTNSDLFFAINDLIKIGITNLSLDLIFALQNQTLKDVKNDLKIVSKLPLKHLSYYSLILEEKTLLYQQYLNSKFEANELEAEMYLLIIQELKKLGYLHYEVSNFAKAEKYQSLHNTLYWNLSLYDAIGAGAHGFDGENRYYYSCNIEKYLQAPEKIVNQQKQEVLIGDYLIFSLRMLKGVNLNKVKELFQIDIFEKYPELTKFLDEDYLEINNDYLKVTLKGLLFLNQIELVFV